MHRANCAPIWLGIKLNVWSKEWSVKLVFRQRKAKAEKRLLSHNKRVHLLWQCVGVYLLYFSESVSVNIELCGNYEFEGRIPAAISQRTLHLKSFLGLSVGTTYLFSTNFFCGFWNYAQINFSFGRWTVCIHIHQLCSPPILNQATSLNLSAAIWK